MGWAARRQSFAPIAIGTLIAFAAYAMAVIGSAAVVGGMPPAELVDAVPPFIGFMLIGLHGVFAYLIAMAGITGFRGAGRPRPR